ncbi:MULTISPECIES: hypothetical protein [Ruegeria]|uniref:Antibiotic biosynthesis monooxygenase n=1 Tax=Ruegeria atlantica TaxID=81569 RepID=A0A0P1EF59_9RHOB|nr:MULTISPECIES: hypothetical protein [Ruegeria]CUH48664.1 hypothetical protein RUA4292_02849 [Ruegeria atlantica]
MTQIAETVTFKLAADVTKEDFVNIMKGTESFVRNADGFVFRRLSAGDDGLWTDTVIWADMDCAQSAAAAFPKQDFAPAVMAAIAPDTVTMRHDAIHWTIGAS